MDRKQTRPRVAAQSRASAGGSGPGRAALTARTPCRGAPADFLAAQAGSITRTPSAILPPVIEKPCVRKVAPSRPHDGHGPAAYMSGLSEKYTDIITIQPPGSCCGMQPGAPENFVGHPIAHAWEDALIKQEGFKRRTGPPGSVSGHQGHVEVARQNLRRQGLPPRGLGLMGIKPQGAEHPRIAENERASPLAKNQMIVPSGDMIRRLRGQFAGHPEVQAQTRPLELKQHLLPVCADAGEPPPGQGPDEILRVHRPENPRPLPAEDHRHAMPEPRRPLTGKP